MYANDKLFIASIVLINKNDLSNESIASIIKSF